MERKGEVKSTKVFNKYDLLDDVEAEIDEDEDEDEKGKEKGAESGMQPSCESVSPESVSPEPTSTPFGFCFRSRFGFGKFCSSKLLCILFSIAVLGLGCSAVALSSSGSGNVFVPNTAAIPTIPNRQCTTACGVSGQTSRLFDDDDGFDMFPSATPGVCYRCWESAWAMHSAQKCPSGTDYVDRGWFADDCCDEYPCLCATGCKDGWVGDAVCNTECDNALCNMDGGDCVPECAVTSTSTGTWEAVKSCATSTGPCTWEERQGTESSSGFVASTEWEHGVENSLRKGWSLNAGIEVKGASAGGSYSEEHTFTENIRSRISTMVSQSTETFQETGLTVPVRGVLWQFQVLVTDTCGVRKMMTKDIAETANAAEPPCCLPTFIKDPSQAHGACTDVLACLSSNCDRATCAGPGPDVLGRGDDPSPSDGDVKIGAIVGGAVGGLVATIVLVIVLVYLLKKRTQPKAPPACPPVTVGVEVDAPAAPPPAGSARLGT